MSKEEDFRRGVRAKAIIDDALFNESFDAVRKKLVAIMESAKTDDATLKAKMCLGLLNDVKQHLSRVMTDGLFAAESIKVEEEAKKRKGWLG